MDQGVRVVLSMGIVTGGAVLALLFRQPSPPVASPISEACRPLVLRGTTAPVPPEPPPRCVAVSPAPAEAPPPVLAVPPRASLDTHEPAPLLAHSYPASSQRSESRWGNSIGIGLPGPSYEPPQMRTHKIVDGDTLSALAERYLGSADRAMELHEANKYLLPSPDVLPIGMELQIPACSPQLTAATTAPGLRQLVPVTPKPSRGR